MDFDLTDEQEELRRSVREVLAASCPLSLVREVVEQAAAPEEPWKSARELGWNAVAVPERFGGLGLGFEELGLIAQEHGRVLAPGPWLPTLTQFAPVVAEAGSEEQRARWLGALAEGSLTGALALTGEGGGLAPDAALRATPDGDGLRLDGERAYVLGGEHADEIAVAARCEAGDGVALAVVPADAVALERTQALDPSRSLARLRCEAHRVPAERVLGVPGACAEPLARALDQSVTALALECVGACQRLLELCIQHARQRVQFERAIGTFQAIQHKLADAFVQVEKAEATAWFAMMAIAADDPRRRLAASMAKAAAGDCQRLLGREAIQIHGGTGFTWECDVQLFVRRSQTDEALLGSAPRHRARVADLLGI